MNRTTPPSRVERPLTPDELERFAVLLAEPGGVPAALLYLLRTLAGVDELPDGFDRTQRRLTWVDGHVKGPKDRPFVERPRVWSVDR